MRKITTILAIGASMLLFTACGGGGGGDTPSGGGTNPPAPTPTEPAYRVTIEGSPYKFTLTQDSYVISDVHCVNPALYDTGGDVMYTNHE
uniref:hypothetical protein n=1 Tax=Sulfurovum sp. TaxID=1969726 RepID=UPI00261250E9